MPTSKKFRKRIKDLIQETDYKRVDLLKKMGINRATLSHILNYGIIPSSKTIIIIADYFDKPFEYILGKTNDEHFEKSEKGEDFYNRIDLLLENNNLKFYSLAINHIGIDQSSLHIWKRKRLLPSIEILLSIAKFFNCSVDFLLGRSDDMDCYSEDNSFDINFDDVDDD